MADRISLQFRVGPATPGAQLSDALSWPTRGAYAAATDEQIDSDKLERWRRWYTMIATGRPEVEDPAFRAVIDPFIAENRAALLNCDDDLSLKVEPGENGKTLQQLLSEAAATLPPLPEPAPPAQPE